MRARDLAFIEQLLRKIARQRTLLAEYDAKRLKKAPAPAMSAAGSGRPATPAHASASSVTIDVNTHADMCRAISFEQGKNAQLQMQVMDMSRVIDELHDKIHLLERLTYAQSRGRKRGSRAVTEDE